MAVLARNEQGQAFTEYILLVAIVVGIYVTVMTGLKKVGLAAKLTKPLQTDFAAAYRFGHPKAKGYDNGSSPTYHPRVDDGGDHNFRIFLNPKSK